MRWEVTPIPTLRPRAPDTVLTIFWGLMQLLWLGFAEPLNGEAGAKAPASLNFLLDKVSDRGIALPLPSYRRARPGVAFQNIPQDARNPRRTKCAAGVSCMSEDVLKSNARAGPDKQPATGRCAIP